MYESIPRKHYLFTWLLLFFAASTSVVHSQETEEEALDSLLDELFFEEEKLLDELLEDLNRGDFIYTLVSFNSDTYFSGRDSGTDQFNIAPQISYYHRSGFTASVSGIYFEEFEPNWDFTSIGLGYYHAIGHKKNFHYYGGYSRYIYSEGNQTFTNSVDLSIGIRSNDRKLGTRLFASYLFGKDGAFQLVSNTYANLQILKDRKLSLKFRPQLLFTVAEQTIALDILNDQGEIQSQTNEVFDLLNTQLKFPVTLYTTSWDFELGYTLNFPNAVANESDLDTTGLVFFSVGYLIDLKKGKKARESK